MFFALKAVKDHPCCKMQDVVDSFLSNSVANAIFSTDLFPKWFRSTLQDPRSTLKAEFAEVHRLLHDAKIPEMTRREVVEEFRTTNLVDELCEGKTTIARATLDWTEPLGKKLTALMGRLYESLDLAVFRRKGQNDDPTHQLYREFITKNKYICPFCGLRRFKNARSVRREDFDHYLPKSVFPLAAANTSNLVPTCGICNQDYKKQKNVLAGGKAFYPYGAVPPVELEITCHRLPSMADSDDKGDWSVRIRPTTADPAASAKIVTWNRVYKIDERLVDEIQEYGEEWMIEVRDDQPPSDISADEFRALVERAKRKAERRRARRMEERQIIRAAFYDFMLNRADPSYLESFRVLLSRLPA